MDQVERETVANILRSFGLNEPGRMARALERLAKAPGEGDAVTRAQIFICDWLCQNFGVERVAIERTLALGRAAFLLSSAAQASEELFLDEALSLAWRERITAAVPAPTPAPLLGEMVEQPLSPLPGLETVARLLVEPNRDGGLS